MKRSIDKTYESMEKEWIHNTIPRNYVDEQRQWFIQWWNQTHKYHNYLDDNDFMIDCSSFLSGLFSSFRCCFPFLDLGLYTIFRQNQTIQNLFNQDLFSLCFCVFSLSHTLSLSFLSILQQIFKYQQLFSVHFYLFSHETIHHEIHKMWITLIKLFTLRIIRFFFSSVTFKTVAESNGTKELDKMRKKCQSKQMACVE